MKLVLDTHALVWWVNGSKEMPARMKREIDKAAKEEGALLVSSISAWEIAMLVERGRLHLSMSTEDWMHAIAGIPAVCFVPVDNNVAIHANHLPGNFHRDPADRMIVALARINSLPVVTADRKILEYKYVRTAG